MKCLGLKWQNVFLFKKSNARRLEMLCALELYIHGHCAKAQKWLSKKFAYISVADELPGISGSHFMAPQNLPFPLPSLCASLPILNWYKWNCMEKKHHNFEMDAPMPLKLWKWLVDAYNNIYKWFKKNGENVGKNGEKVKPPPPPPPPRLSMIGW